MGGNEPSDDAVELQRTYAKWDRAKERDKLLKKIEASRLKRASSQRLRTARDEWTRARERFGKQLWDESTKDGRQRSRSEHSEAKRLEKDVLRSYRRFKKDSRRRRRELRKGAGCVWGALHGRV